MNLIKDRKRTENKDRSRDKRLENLRFTGLWLLMLSGCGLFWWAIIRLML